MKKGIVVIILSIFVGCKSVSSNDVKKPLFELLTQQSTGGASIRFFEILTEENEIKMLENDENLKNKIKPGATKTANFIILNMGEKNSGGYSIKVGNVEETPDSIIVSVIETEPAKGEMATTVMTTPYAIVRINSKKKIVIR